MKTTEFTMPEITISYKDNVKASERVKILSSETSYSYLKPFYSECMEHHEESYVMFLNRANKALGVSLISKGGMSETVMDVKIILQTALKVHASGIILSHNHPSGNLHPSEPDKKITTKINEACKVLDLHLLDHISHFFKLILAYLQFMHVTNKNNHEFSIRRRFSSLFVYFSHH